MGLLLKVILVIYCIFSIAVHAKVDCKQKVEKKLKVSMFQPKINSIVLAKKLTNNLRLVSNEDFSNRIILPYYEFFDGSYYIKKEISKSKIELVISKEMQVLMYKYRKNLDIRYWCFDD
jgi:hypothetical protein